MMIIARGDAEDVAQRQPVIRASGLATSAENWDDDFEFHGDDAPPAEDLSDVTHAPLLPIDHEEHEESWDDAYADDDTPASPIRRAGNLVAVEEVEDWDSSDNEAEQDHVDEHEFGFGGYEEEDKTVTAKSNLSSRRRSRETPPPPLPFLPSLQAIPPMTQSIQQMYTLPQPPLPTASPTLSSFSIPLSSHQDHASVYSQNPLLRSSSGSAPQLALMRSYPHGAGSTPPRRSRRLKKKSRPPEADIFELEDREPEPPQAFANLATRRSSHHLSVPPSTPPPNVQETPAAPSSPASSPSLLTRIGSFKRWARRSIGPDDPSFVGWRRARSSTGPPDIRVSKSSQGPKTSTSPEDVLLEEIAQSASAQLAAPVASSSKTRARGASASGLKSGWFFRSGGTGGSNNTHQQQQEVSSIPPSTRSQSPLPPSHSGPIEAPHLLTKLSPQKKSSGGGLSPLRKRMGNGKAKEKELEEDLEGDERDGLTPTPRKSKGKLVPILRKKKASTTPNGESTLARPLSMVLQNESSSTQAFPTYTTSSSIGRHTGAPIAALAVAGANGIALPVEGERDQTKGKESHGMRSLMNGVRRISLVGQGHKRNKSGSLDASVAVAAVAASATDTDLSSPMSANGRRGSLPWLDHSPPGQGQHGKQSRRCSHDGMETYSFGEPPSTVQTVSFAPVSYGKLSPGSPTRPRPTRPTSALATSSRSVSPVPPPSPSAFRTTLRPESVASTSRSDSRVPSSSSGSQAVSSRPLTPNRPKTPIHAVPVISSTQQRPLTPSQQRPATPSRPLTPGQRPPPIITNGQHAHAFGGQSASLGRATAPPHSTSLGRTASPPSASLGRSASQSSQSGVLKRNSFNDLKKTPGLLGDHKPSLTTLGENKLLPGSSGEEQRHRSLEDRKASVNTLGDLKIPARISKAQQGLKRDLGMVREFAGCVEHLKKLQATYRKLIGELCVAYDSYPATRQPSRPCSQLAGRSSSRLTSNPNPSTHSFVQTPGTQTSTSVSSPRKSRSFSRASNDLHRELARLEHEYGLWWECAELLVDLGGGTGTAAVVAGSVSNPNLSHHSSISVIKTAPAEVLTTTSSARFPAHVSSKSDPGLLLYDSLQIGGDKGPPQASRTQWRASSGRQDLNPRQLQLLRDMLNTPDPASLADTAETYGYGLGRDGFMYTGPDDQTWTQWNASCVTLPSEESSADMDAVVDPAMATQKQKEKKRRISKLGILGLRDLLFGLKKKAVEEGRLPQRSESSLSSHAEVDDDFYNRRRSPWYQHEPHHVREVVVAAAPVVPIPSKSPRRPSLASIFRIGYKSSKHSGKKEEPPPSATQSSTTGDDRLNGADYPDWEKMSASDLDLSAVPSGMATVRGRKNANYPPTSFSNTNIGNHPYGYHDATTPKKSVAATSRTSLREPVQAVSIMDSDMAHKPTGLSRPGKHRTSSWSQAASPSHRPSSRNGRAPMSGTVRSAPPADLSLPEPKLSLTPENIKPLLEYAKEVSLRLAECISEVEGLLGIGMPTS